MLQLYYIKENYLQFLNQYESKVAKSHGMFSRPFVGVVFSVNGFFYFAPLSSPKKKHLLISSRALDIFKIDKGKYGIVNLNNMIPVPSNVIEKIDVDALLNGNEQERSYGILLNNQVRFLNAQDKKLLRKANILYSLVGKKECPPSLLLRCCDFKKLEEVSSQFKNL